MSTSFTAETMTLSNTLRKVYVWMAAALAISGVAAYLANELGFTNILNMPVFIGIAIAELALVFILSFAIKKLNVVTALLMFMLYSVLNGLTLSFIFVAYAGSTIAGAFFVSAGTFAVMSIYGYFTKKDLSGWGRLLLMLLIGVIIATVVNIFVASDGLYWATTYIGLLVFVLLTAYDTQKIKVAIEENEGRGDLVLENKIAIMGALELYLDFINIFLYLLRIFGRRD